MEKLISIFGELVDKYVEDSVENFDEVNKYQNLIEDSVNEFKSIQDELEKLREKVVYFEQRFPEFLKENTEYQEKFYPYLYKDE